jgi:uncharacterized protein YndB with AHSA1/START domain
MKTLKFTTSINASAEKLWQTLWEDATYRQWTSLFSEGSHAVSSWKEGERILFLGANGDGMFSEIAKLTPNAYMAFRHLGMIKDGVEQPATEETKGWSGAMETYTLQVNGNSVTLTATIDSVDEFAPYFEEKFPLALGKLKDLAEA